ncbi:MAG: ATP-grasp domain-containing protein [Planctomycetia bacterium]|nr:ATP-grasp domain-containing protein [Planctomycetia bacterium]
MRNKVVLITAISSVSPDIAIKTARQMGMRIVGCDINERESIVDAMNVDVFYKSPRGSEETSYITFILDLICKENIDYILPSTDVEVDTLNKHREEIARTGATLLISDEEAIKLCRNKYLTYEFLKSSGVKYTIPTAYLNEVNPKDIVYPVVCKPSNGRSSEGLYYVNTQDELSLIPDDNNYLIQPKIEGVVITVDVIRHPYSKQTVAIPRRELLRTYNGLGLSVYLFHDEELENLSCHIADLLNIRGCVNFEYIEDISGRRYFMDCNPRFSGGIEFSCIAGYQCVENHFRCFTDDTIDNGTEIMPMYIARKYEEYVTREG